MSEALAFVGDWNGTPADRGRWSPHWLAVQADLRIASAGPGRHGDIDYAMTDAKVLHEPVRRPPPGAASGDSDHDVYVVLLRSPDDKRVVLLASWNMLYGRGNQRAESDLTQLLHRGDIDVLALQEAADYHRAIRDMARLHGYHVVMSGTPGRWHNVLLVRGPLAPTDPRFVQLSPHGWKLVTGGQHRELWATSCTVAGWLRVAVVHLPPSVNWPRGRIRGPLMRVAAYVSSASKLLRWARNNRRRR